MSSNGDIHTFKTGIYYSDVRFHALLAAAKMYYYDDSWEGMLHGMNNPLFWLVNEDDLSDDDINYEVFDTTIYSQVHIADDGEMYFVATEDTHYGGYTDACKYFNRQGLCRYFQRLSNYHIFNKVDKAFNGKISKCFIKHDEQYPQKVFYSMSMAISNNDRPLGRPMCNPFAQTLFAEKKEELKEKISKYSGDANLFYDRKIIKELNDTYHKMISIVSKELEE